MKRQYVTIRETLPLDKNTKQFFFTLYAANGQVLAHSESYTKKANAFKMLAKYFSDFDVKDYTTTY
jgi:hypothetical protein